MGVRGDIFEVRHRVPVWVDCPHCEDKWCNLHQQHVADCECPHLDIWIESGVDPEDPIIHATFVLNTAFAFLLSPPVGSA